MATTDIGVPISLLTVVILTAQFMSVDAWSGSRCRYKSVTYYYTEYYCCDGWAETIQGNEICTKRVPLLNNVVTSYNEVPSLAWRSLTSDEEVIDDRALPSGVYTAGGSFDIVTKEVDATAISCGAKRNIWMNDTLPDADGSFHNKTVCITDPDTNNPCMDTFTIEVHNGGGFRVYALEPLNSSLYGLENDTVAYCFDLSVSGDPCSASIPTSLPELESHRPGNTDVVHSDEHLTDNWYSVEPYQIVTNSPEFDSPIQCGAGYQIWMNDSFPEDDGKHHVRELCITDPVTSDTCESNHYTFIRNCGGSFRYFLEGSPIPDSAYCFDIPSDSDDPAPDFTPSNVKIDFSLNWTPLGLTSSSFKPSLLFQCSFDKDTTQDLFYVIYFYVDGAYIDTGSQIVVQDPSEAIVNERTLFNRHGFSAGITISCHVGTRSSRNGRTGITVKSLGFYAGIKMVHDSIDIQRGGKDVVSFFPTVPFGCEYNPSNPRADCYLTLFISDNTTHDTCGSNTLQHQCTVQMKGLTKTDYNAGVPWAINSTFDVITAESKIGSYNLASRQFTLRLNTGRTTHTFWQNYKSEAVTININEMEKSQLWQGKTCGVYCDPHHVTFDGMRFELHYPGKFLLFESTNPPMKVQIEIKSCYYNGNSAPYCACGIVAIAGQDVYQIYNCHGENINKFMACNDNVLKAEMIHSRLYEIYLPTGATIKVKLRGYLMDIDIIPTQHEYQKVSGLCGNFDGDKCNDCVSRGGRSPCTTPAPNGCHGGWTYFPNDFTSSFRLTEEESLLNVSPNMYSLEPYSTSNQVCVCPEGTASLDDNGSAGSFSSITHCTYTQYASCEAATKDIKCRQHLVLSYIRGKRSVPQNTDTYQHEREERSVVMTESEAAAACSLALMASPTYTTCVNMGISSSEIETCTADLMITGDNTWISYAVDRFQAACVDVIAKNSTLQQLFPDDVNAILNLTCPNSCSEQGSCIDGVCNCDEGFASDDCSFNLTSPLVVSSLENGDMCDIQHGCDLILVNGPNFPNGRNYTCQFTGQMSFVNSTKWQLDVQNVTAEYQSLFGLLCNLPNVTSLPGQLGIEYSISVAMDTYEFSTALSFVVINALCQTFTYEAGTASFNTKNGYCFIDSVCMLNGTESNENLCQECDSQNSLYTWSQSTDCTVSDLSSRDGGSANHVTVIVAVTCSVVLVLVLVGLGIVYWKLHTNSPTKERDSVTAVYTVRPDAVGNIHFGQSQNYDKPHRLPPIEDKPGRMFHKDNKTLPFPLKGDI